MLNMETRGFVPYRSPLQARIVPVRISAIPIVAEPEGAARLGIITQLPQAAELQITGEGFNERTIKVRWNDSCYFVFRDDIEIVSRN